MNLAIIGSRSIIPDPVIILDKLRELAVHSTDEDPIQKIISGGAVGVDTVAGVIANNLQVEFLELKPDYSKYGKAAPHVRNNEIIEQADLIIAVWDGASKGTQSVIKKARKRGKKVIVINYHEEEDKRKIKPKEYQWHFHNGR